MGFVLLLLFLITDFVKTLGNAFLRSSKHFVCRGISAVMRCNNSSQNESGFSVYEGRVWHQRRHPILHSFEYDVKYALINLDANHSPRSLGSAVLSRHMDAHQVRSITRTSGPVHLLTIPTNLGYEQNPISVYYCYEAEGPSIYLKVCIAEVTNTPWGEKSLFVFSPNSDTVAKALHVSPFMDMLGVWKIHASNPDSLLSLTIHLHHPESGDYFTAMLKAKRLEYVPLNLELLFWLMPHKVAIRIYWQAFQLWWKGVPFITHPKYATGKAYRDQALKHANNIGRWCTWKDAQWPWA